MNLFLKNRKVFFAIIAIFIPVVVDILRNTPLMEGFFVPGKYGYCECGLHDAAMVQHELEISRCAYDPERLCGIELANQHL